MSDDQRRTDGPDERDEVGSIAEEAAKLFGALAGRAGADRDGSSGGMSGLAGLATHAAAAAREVDEHLATGSGECTWCPLCRTVHAVRQTSPEVRAHLATAASSLLQAAAGLLATAVPTERADGVEHIDLDEDWPEDEG